MKKYLVVLIGLCLIMALCAFVSHPVKLLAPPVPTPAPAVVEIPVKDIGAGLNNILAQLFVIFASAGVPVLLANAAKNLPFMKWMDGKTDKVVEVLVFLVFGCAVYLQLFNQNLFNELYPWFANNLKIYVNYANMALGLIAALWSIIPISKGIKNKVPVFGKSFSTPMPKK